MFNGSMQNDHSIKSHTSEPYVTKDKHRVTEIQNTIVVKKEKKSWLQKVKEWFTKK